MSIRQGSQAKVISLIKQAIQDERDDIQLYEYLICIAPTFEEREILSSIRNSKRERVRWLMEIYRCLTGCEYCPVDCCSLCYRPISYIEGIRKALFNEINALDKYRIIRENLTNRCYRDVLFRIITDILTNIAKLNYILALYSIPTTPVLPISTTIPITTAPTTTPTVPPVTGTPPTFPSAIG